MPIELTPGKITLLLGLPALLVLSALISGSETALFGLRPHERSLLRQRDDHRSRSILAMLSRPRSLLVTLLLCNMAVNTLYFIISSVLMQSAGSESKNRWLQVMAVAPVVLGVIVVGDLTPKLLADRHRIRWLDRFGWFIAWLYRIAGPACVPLDRFVITPLVRLFSAAGSTQPLSAAEVADLAHVAAQEGAINADERELLVDLVELSRRKVREIMIPRVRMSTLDRDADRVAVIAAARRSGEAFLPVIEDSDDNIVGVIDVKRYLLDRTATTRPLIDFVAPPTFIPELASLDHLIRHFRIHRVRLALVVDEYGQTAGCVSLEDVLQHLLAHPAGPGKSYDTPPILLTGLGRWRVRADSGLHDFAEAFGIAINDSSASTVGGYMRERLGDLGRVGEATDVGRWRLTVAETRGSSMVAIDVELLA